MSQNPDTLTESSKSLFNIAMAGENFDHQGDKIATVTEPGEGFAAADGAGHVYNNVVNVPNKPPLRNSGLQSRSVVGALSRDIGRLGAGASSTTYVNGDVFVPNGAFINNPNKAPIGVAVTALVLPTQEFESCSLGCGIVIHHDPPAIPLPTKQREWVLSWDDDKGRWEYCLYLTASNSIRFSSQAET